MAGQMGELSLKKVEEHIEQLPLLPSILFQLMKSDPEGEGFFDEMVSLAKSDPPLASLIIGYANSAACAGSQQVDSIEASLARVGSHTILQLLMALSVARVFIPTKDEQQNIWRHSLEVAHIALFLARSPYFYSVKAETAYMSGLLHDLGRFVMLQVAPDALESTDVRGWGAAEEFIRVEETILGYTHTTVGKIAAKKMHLPILISNVIGYHHSPEIVNHPKVREEMRDMLVIIQFSDALSFFLASNPEWIEMSDEMLIKIIRKDVIPKNWGQQNLPLAELVHALPKIFSECDDACEMLGIRPFHN